MYQCHLSMKSDDVFMDCFMIGTVALASTFMLRVRAHSLASNTRKLSWNTMTFNVNI